MNSLSKLKHAININLFNNELYLLFKKFIPLLTLEYLFILIRFDSPQMKEFNLMLASQLMESKFNFDLESFSWDIGLLIVFLIVNGLCIFKIVYKYYAGKNVSKVALIFIVLNMLTFISFFIIKSYNFYVDQEGSLFFYSLKTILLILYSFFTGIFGVVSIIILSVINLGALSCILATIINFFILVFNAANFLMKKRLVKLISYKNGTPILGLFMGLTVICFGFIASKILKKQIWLILFTIMLIFTLVNDSNYYFFTASSMLIIFFIIIIDFVTFFQVYIKNKFEIILFMVLIVTLFSFFNNNHKINYINYNSKNETEVIAEQNLLVNFKNWMQSHTIDDTSDTNESIPVYFIACEGGGSRSMSWTGGALNAINNSYPSIMENTYYLSGVSGGSVGISLFLSYLKDSRYNNLIDSSSYTSLVNMGCHDYLTPLISTFLFGETAQRFIPFPISEFDRSRQLENSWSKQYYLTFGYNTLDYGLKQIYRLDSLSYLPNVVFNATVAETGNKAFCSNLDLEGALPKGLDLIKLAHKDIPLKTCASLSSRFPYITPSGEFSSYDNSITASVVDGGYLENTGIQSCLEIISYLQTHMDEVLEERICKRIKFAIIFIKNSNYNESKNISNSSQLTTPSNALLSSWSAGTSFYYNILPSILSKAEINIFTIQLDRDLIVDHNFAVDYNDLALGWYLSPRSQTKLIFETLQINRGFEYLNSDSYYDQSKEELLRVVGNYSDMIFNKFIEKEYLHEMSKIDSSNLETIWNIYQFNK